MKSLQSLGTPAALQFNSRVQMTAPSSRTPKPAFNKVPVHSSCHYFQHFYDSLHLVPLCDIRLTTLPRLWPFYESQKHVYISMSLDDILYGLAWLRHTGPIMNWKCKEQLPKLWVSVKQLPEQWHFQQRNITVQCRHWDEHLAVWVCAYFDVLNNQSKYGVDHKSFIADKSTNRLVDQID